MGAAGESTVLAPPGAGLPKLELFLARMAFGFARASASRTQAARLFRAEASCILTLARDLDADFAAQPVLIKRIYGIEDSSRNWSVYMTLDHLVIVNRWILEIIETLAAGKLYAKPVSTAAVKPPVEQDAAVLEAFENFVDKFSRRVSELPDLRKTPRHAHPWFGPLDAHGWNCLAAVHQRIHRRQVEAILAAAANR